MNLLSCVTQDEQLAIVHTISQMKARTDFFVVMDFLKRLLNEQDIQNRVAEDARLYRGQGVSQNLQMLIDLFEQSEMIERQLETLLR